MRNLFQCLGQPQEQSTKTSLVPRLILCKRDFSYYIGNLCNEGLHLWNLYTWSSVLALLLDLESSSSPSLNLVAYTLGNNHRYPTRFF